VNWWQVVPTAQFFDEAGDHAGELEKSVMMHLTPTLVRPLDQAGPGAARKNQIRGFREGWAWMPRPWSQVTDDTGVGNPARATAEKGRRYFDTVTEAIGAFLVDLATADPEALYE
jgi:creatinine amidohydrolase